MVVALLLLAAVAAPPPPFAGCAWVRAENDGAGAGFVVDADKRLLVTCRHVVAARKVVDVIFPWVRNGELVTDRDAYLGNRPRLRELGLLVTGKVLKTSDDLDLALLELESLPPGTKAVTFAQRPPPPGEPLHLVGNRLDLDTVWNATTGPVRASGRLADGYFWRGKKLAANAAAIIGQLPTEEGDSGAAVFDSRGEVVGIATALRRQCPLAAVVISGGEVRKFAAPVAASGVARSAKPQPAADTVAEALTRATVWVRPTATDIHRAGVLVEADLVLTVGKGLVPGDRAGVAVPVRNGETWNAERAVYRDPLALHLRGCWRGATVLARDATHDLVLLRLDSPVAFMRPLPLATALPPPGDAVHAMNHPAGLEFAWVYAGGAVRQHGRVAIADREGSSRPHVLLVQLPAQAGSPGGPVANDRGELVGILAAKESAQMVGYAVAADEIAAFLDANHPARPARTLAGLVARVVTIPDRLASEIAARSIATRVQRAKMLPPSEAIRELDAAVEKGPFDRGVLVLRADLAAGVNDWRKARGDLERVLDVTPADAAARRRLVPVLLELGKDAEAAAAVRDVLRADPKLLAAVAADLLVQADGLAKKYPEAPSVPAGWLAKAMTAATCDAFAAILEHAAAATDDVRRLAILRDGLNQVTK